MNLHENLQVRAFFRDFPGLEDQTEIHQGNVKLILGEIINATVKFPNKIGKGDCANRKAIILNSCVRLSRYIDSLSVGQLPDDNSVQFLSQSLPAPKPVAPLLDASNAPEDNVLLSNRFSSLSSIDDNDFLDIDDLSNIQHPFDQVGSPQVTENSSNFPDNNFALTVNDFDFSKLSPNQCNLTIQFWH